MGKFFVNTTIFGWVEYTSYIRPVCLPCSKTSCVAGFLKNEKLLTDEKTEEEKCETESNIGLKLH